jgi:hypothetical protein
MHRTLRINNKRQLTFTKEELESIHAAPGDTLELWTEDGLDSIILSKADESEKDTVAEKQ